jgi:hypothetical protein
MSFHYATSRITAEPSLVFAEDRAGILRIRRSSLWAHCCSENWASFCCRSGLRQAEHAPDKRFFTPRSPAGYGDLRLLEQIPPPASRGRRLIGCPVNRGGPSDRGRSGVPFAQCTGQAGHFPGQPSSSQNTRERCTAEVEWRRLRADELREMAQVHLVVILPLACAYGFHPFVRDTVFSVTRPLRPRYGDQSDQCPNARGEQ